MGMVELAYLDDNCKAQTINVVRIEKADVRPPYDKHIRSIETYTGWWELWNIDGVVCGYFESDEDIDDEEV
jgi:hypothetical protein